MRVATADSGWSALEQIEHVDGFDVILVDLHMPGMDGESLVRRISAERVQPRPRFVMLLTLVDGAVRSRAAELGLAACITKPVKRTQLRNSLADLFSVAKPAMQPAPGSEHVTPLAEPLNIKVLLADDNLVGRRVTQAILRRLGCEADIAGNGHEVLSALEMHRYDAVLMDVFMPGMDGLETTRRIRKDLPADQQPWIIALTASAIMQELNDASRRAERLLGKTGAHQLIKRSAARIPAVQSAEPPSDDPAQEFALPDSADQQSQ